MTGYEKLGVFYLGKEYDLEARLRKDAPVLYDSKDLTTHAVIIGMTGSGKTGLGLTLLEEALIDNIPVIAIDPKGDIPNLLLQFPELRPDDFLPWIDRRDALSRGVEPAEAAHQIAEQWRQGLAQWDQSPDRIARLRQAADFAVYTPGSTAGLPVSVLKSFAPPPAELRNDPELVRERIQTTTTGLLALLGIEADPLTSREHILIANIFESSWNAGKGLDLAGLIRTIQEPPFARIGVMDMDVFYPAKERFSLALRINNLLAAPGFEAWLQGEPLDIGRMIHTEHGKPRAVIFTISHLTDSERMFFVAMLLTEIAGWLRTQPGTSSLRAILYMDEIFGFFPPVQNPPTKVPMLTLLKQARAFGLGIVLSTQNPVDIDYKGLSNTGTWFIGRLQTERDKERVLAGLEGAAAGTEFDRRRMNELLSELGKRIFLLHNVHDHEPVIFETRWVLSYMQGPMTREQIKQLVSDTSRRSSQDGTLAPLRTAAPEHAEVPLPPPGVSVFFVPASGAGQGLIYRPAIAGWVNVHYSESRSDVDTTRRIVAATFLKEGPQPLDWDAAFDLELETGDLEATPLSGALFGKLPDSALKASAYEKWSKDILRWVRQSRPLVLYFSDRLQVMSRPEESEGAFRARLTHHTRDRRDLDVEKLRGKYSDDFARLKDRLARADQAVAREQEQAKARKVETVISFGTALLSAFLGRRTVSAGSVSRMGTAVKSAGRIQKEKMDVVRAQETSDGICRQIATLEEQLQEDLRKLDASYDPGSESLKEIRIKPKAQDVSLEVFGLLWLPFRTGAAGRESRDWT
jgi:hypothetical protein